MSPDFVIQGGNDCFAANYEKPLDWFAGVLKDYGVILLMQETSHNELVELDGELPSDTHLVHYQNKEGQIKSDAVRAFTMEDIFDAYHDCELKVNQIKSGYGRVKPKLWSDARKDANTKVSPK